MSLYIENRGIALFLVQTELLISCVVTMHIHVQKVFSDKTHLTQPLLMSYVGLS